MKNTVQGDLFAFKHKNIILQTDSQYYAHRTKLTYQQYKPYIQINIIYVFIY